MKFKKMKTILTVSLITMLFTPMGIIAQDRIDENDIKDMVRRNIVPTIQKTEVSGTPYYSEDFTNGSFELYSGRYAEGLTMNYNIYERRIEYRSNGNTYAIDPSGIRHFTLENNGQNITFKKGYESRRLDGDEFVEVMAEGAVTFLVKHEVSYNEGANSGYGSATKQASYSGNERYYFAKDGEVSYERRLNERRVMRYFNGNSEVKTFIQQNNLDLSRPADIARAVNKYNEMTS